MDEVTNPYDLSRKKKWIVTAIVALAGAAAPMGSSIVLPALVDITREFDSTATIANLSVAMYMLNMSIFPLWWRSFSETLGRRSIYVVSFCLFLVFNVLAAVSVNMAMFIVILMMVQTAIKVNRAEYEIVIPACGKNGFEKEVFSNSNSS